MTNNNEYIEKILTNLKNGCELTQRAHEGAKYPHYFFLHHQEQYITYHREDKKGPPSPRYYIHKIDEVRSGYNTRTFARLVRRHLIDENEKQCAFSIFYNNYRDELHLVAPDEQTRDNWIDGLQYLMKSHIKKRQRHVINETNWIMNYFYLADKDGSNKLSKKECKKLLVDILNAKISTNEFDKLFQLSDKSGEGLLSSDEFIDFFHLLIRRRDLYKIMQKYVENGEEQPMDTISMDANELLYFLQNIQKQMVIKPASNESKLGFSLQLISTIEEADELIQEFELNTKIRDQGKLSLDGFRNLLLGEDFDLMKPWCSRYVYQDMTRPLSDYYIKTSHNTYLFNTQLTGDSNPEAYNRVLSKGCRAVEIDCYDGNNGRPIVKHGFTLVRPCLFESIIRFIEPNLFKTSPYPVILDIENHCSLDQQYEMARILVDVLGDRLVTEPLLSENSTVLPSPEDLKYKVLVRGVKLSSPIEIPKIIKQQLSKDESKPKTYGLSDLFVYLQNVPFIDYIRAKDDYTCCHSANIAEKHFDRAIKTDPLGVIKQTIKSSLRMYPDGLRQDSSNPNPILPWNFGVQMVALNYQYDDSMMSLSYGKFLDNGGCGYVLKPEYLIDVDKTLFNPLKYIAKPSIRSETILEQPQRLILTIISGQFLPRASETSTDIPDCFVTVSTHGIACDEKSFRTKTINNNGFDPEWNQTFEFDIHFSQMCLVRFNVYDDNLLSKNDRLAYFCLPFTTMQTGYRHIHLKSRNNSLTYSTLFVHVEIQNI